MENILLQIGIITPLIMAASEWLPLPINIEWRKRVSALLWALIFSFAAWMLGLIDMPATFRVDSGWAEYAVIAICSAGNVALAHGLIITGKSILK